MANKAVLAGASGLIGSALLDILLTHSGYNEVTILVRKKLPVAGPKLIQRIVDFDSPASYNEFIDGGVIFCCLGSTRKKTPHLKDYRKVDHDYPLQLAEAGFNHGVKQYHFVSSMGADAASSNYYKRMKGETEEDLKKTGIAALYIYRPSLLTGQRNERRFAERIFTVIMKAIDPILTGKLKKYKSIPATTVAMAMFKQSLTNQEGTFTYPSDKIKQLS